MQNIQCTKHIIDRAIEKAKGSGDEQYSELRYEGFGPNGSMVIVDTLTNNVNRTAADVRAAFGKNGGNMVFLARLLTCLIIRHYLVFLVRMQMTS